MNLDYRGEQALAGARAFRQAQDKVRNGARHDYRQPSPAVPRPAARLAAPATSSSATRHQPAA